MMLQNQTILITVDKIMVSQMLQTLESRSTKGTEMYAFIIQLKHTEIHRLLVHGMKQLND